jgi:hypothetical protein
MILKTQVVAIAKRRLRQEVSSGQGGQVATHRMKLGLIFECVTYTAFLGKVETLGENGVAGLGSAKWVHGRN